LDAATIDTPIPFSSQFPTKFVVGTGQHTVPTVAYQQVPDVTVGKCQAFLAKLHTIFTQKGISRCLFDDIVKLINDGMTCGALDPLMDPLPTSCQSTFNMMEKMFPIPCPIAMNPNLALCDHVKVMTFDFKEMLEDILASPEIRDCNNLAVDPKDPFGVPHRELIPDPNHVGESHCMVDDCQTSDVIDQVCIDHNLHPALGD